MDAPRTICAILALASLMFAVSCGQKCSDGDTGEVPSSAPVSELALHFLGERSLASELNPRLMSTHKLPTNFRNLRAVATSQLAGLDAAVWAALREGHYGGVVASTDDVPARELSWMLSQIAKERAAVLLDLSNNLSRELSGFQSNNK